MPTRNTVQRAIIADELACLANHPTADEVYEYDCEGKPTIQLPAGSKARKAVEEIACKLFK